MSDTGMSHTLTSERYGPPVEESESNTDRTPSQLVKEAVLQEDDKFVLWKGSAQVENGSTNVQICEDQEMSHEKDQHMNGENLEKEQHEAGNGGESENVSRTHECQKELHTPKLNTSLEGEGLNTIEKSPNGRHGEESPTDGDASTGISGMDNSSTDQISDPREAGTEIESSSGNIKETLKNIDTTNPSDLEKKAGEIPESTENGQSSDVARETKEDTCTNEVEEMTPASQNIDETAAIHPKEESATSEFSRVNEDGSLTEAEVKAERKTNNEVSDKMHNDKPILEDSGKIQIDVKNGDKKPEDGLPSTSSTMPSSVTQERNAESYSVNDGQSFDDNVTEKPTKYRCSKCSCVTKDKRLFDNHSCDRELGSEEDKVKITIELNKGTNAFMCKECNFSSTGHGFEEHLMCHLMLRPYQCLYCKECFINRREISRHVIKSHNGAKMSCALRALRRAKGLIKEVTAAGTLTFMARVAGKVPLEKDPEKKKIFVPQAKPSDASAKSPVPTSQSNQSKESAESEEKCQKQEEENKEDFKCTSEEIAMQDSNSNSSSAVPFSKLREVLTSENPLQLVEGKDSDETTSSPAPINEEVKEQKKVEEQGLKIIASYSLHDEPSIQEAPTEENKEQENNPQKSPQPNFFMASPPFTPEPELVSFLGPERSGHKYSDRSSPLLPPPPLKPVPPQSDVPSTSSVDTFQRTAMPTKPEKTSNFFNCSFNCSFNSISKSEYVEHLMDFHSNETSFSCYYCGHKSLHVEDMVNHTVSHADNSTNKKSPLFICSTSDCQFGSNMITDFINHVNTSHKDGNKPACNACVSVFPEVSMLQTHLEENIIHIVNCPHCQCKASDRRAILNHISSEHPGKPKMVSVVKQLICRDRKMNGYERVEPAKDMHPPSLASASNSSHGHSVLDHILRRQDARNAYTGPHCNSGMADSLTGSVHTSPRNTPSPASRGLSPFSSRKHDDTPESERSPRSETSGFSGVRVKEEIEEIGYEDSKDTDGILENNSSYIIDENGVRKRLYVPMSERHAENFCCRYCTFVARDLKRLACHERSHGMPPTRKDRFKCMFCPQGFDSEMKFRLHITCHPGLIKFLLYKCKKCEFDSNQKHTIVKHITCNRDRKHRGIGPVEDQYSIISRSLESRVLECEQCDYMTRHKVHMAIHYQREHGILRDKNEFTIEGLTPSDTPVTGPEFGQFGGLSPQHEVNSQLDLNSCKSFSASKKRKESTSSDGTNLSMGEIYERNELFTRLVSQQAALQPGHVLENQARKFKCPICKYLLPKAADLKNHVKRHSEIGQITLVMFRCKYCSCMSTARELLYDHLRDKHPGKSIALVKKIVAIDTTETDKSFAETSVEESLQQLEQSVHNEIMSAINSSQSQSTPPLRQSSSSRSLEQLFVIPNGGDTFEDALQCPKCSHSSHHRDEIIQHVTEKHPEVKIISSDEDVDNLAKSTSEDLHRSNLTHETDPSPLPSQEEVLIVPDEPTFKETALCSRCDFSTNLRKDMVLHLQQNHPEISVMGRNSYPVQVSTMGSKLGENVLEESCVVGSGSLDSKLRVLYENYGTQMKCLICGIERPKKFFIHVHILRHLNIYLWKCTFCSHRGLQKYKMVDHIKKIHPGRPMSVRYLRVNVESRVAQFLAQFNTIQNRVSMPDNMDSPEEFMDPGGDDSKSFSQKSQGGIQHALGGEELDAKISCLYDFSDGLFYKCLACNNQFQRKFAIHRHIIISHLKVALLSCAYCGMEGVEKHQMVDHILACHHSQPVSFHTNDIDIVQAVANFLAKSAASDDFDAGLGSSKSGGDAEDYYHRILSGNKSKFGNLGRNFKFPFGPKPKGKNLIGKKKTTGNKNKTIVDPGVIMLGREALDKELNSLYQARPGGQLRCLICRWEFPRKYPLHRHIMLKHLRMNLVACPYCSFNGVEKYTVSTHIKEEHRDQPISIRYIQPDVKERVCQFMNEMASGSSKIKKQMSSTSPPSLSMLVKMKREKSLNFDNDANEEEEREEEEDDDEKNEGTSAAGSQSLVVAMFGKKNKKASLGDDIVIKTEREDDEYDASTQPNLSTYSENNNQEEEEEEGEEDEEEDGAGSELDNNPSNFDMEDYKSESDRNFLSEGVDNKNLSKFQKMEAYAPGSYRSPTGGKPKALDVITKIKVLKSREGPITKFYCEKCKFTSVHRSNIVRHIYKIHERYQTHTCPVCNYQTLSMMLMQTHMSKEHPGTEYNEDSFALNPPHAKPRSRSLLGLYNYQQRRRKQKFKAPAPLPPAPPPPTTSSDRGPKQYACAYCHYETNTQEDILEHTREKHSQGYTHSESVSHSSKKTEDGSKACWDRSKKAVKRRLSEGSETVAHTHTKRKFVFEKGDELIQCGHCDVRETSMGRMQHHMEVDHPGFPMQFKRIPAWRFVCKTCAVKTMATSKMKYHLNRHVSYRPYTCINCGAFFPSPDQCRRHSRANRHDEQYMYVRNAKKEQRVEELLQETRQLALRIQSEAFSDPTFDIANIEAFMARYQDSKGNLKRTGSGTSARAAKKAKVEEKSGQAVRKQVGKSPQTVGIEMNVTIKCYNCEFQATTVNDVMLHHKKAHPGEQFYWTELDRGFTCDRTGEALPNCDTLPNSSGDVGYSTKISLSVGSNSTRFKCKSCDFSSSVIQAMKSHLKSHQPKGYICPYCSRFFSGKEKLMRHQYCLHRGLSIWVIHLRKPSANSSTTGRANSAGSSGSGHSHVTRSTRDISSEKESIAEEEDRKGTNDDEIDRGSPAQLRYVCNECSFSSDNLLQYRQHLSKAHAAFRQGVKETSATIEESEEENGIESPIQTEMNFQCGYCNFQASEMKEIEEHHEETHAGDEPQILDVSAVRSQDEVEEAGPIEKPLLNLEPRVAVKRIPSATIAWYDDAHSAHSDDAIEEFDESSAQFEEIGMPEAGEFDGSSPMHPDKISENDAERDDEEENFAEEGVSLSGVDEENVEKEASDETVENRYQENAVDSPFSEVRKEGTEEAEEENLEDQGNENTNESDMEYEENDEAEMNVSSAENPDDLARQFGLVDDTISSPVRSESEMMIMEFDSLQRNQMLTAAMDNEISEDEKVDGSAEVSDGEDGEDDEDEDEFDENSVTLASPLPMISLGDGVRMSPDMFNARREGKSESEANQDNSEKEVYDTKNLLDF